jgi:hypothetical protein
MNRSSEGRRTQWAMIVALATCVWVATASRAAVDVQDAGAGVKAVTVDAAAQVRFGVAITILKSAAAPNGIATTARVLDPGPLVQLDSELATAAATFSASRAEALRTRKLFEEDRTASRRAVEAATAQEQADLQRVNTARRQLALEWGSGLAGLPAHRRAELLDELTHGQAELIRVEIPSGVPLPAAGSTIGIRGSAESEVLGGSVLGTLPMVEPHLQTRGVLVELKGTAAAKLPIGEMLSAEIPAAAALATASGVVLPRSALLRKSSRVWVYVQTAPTTFQRREVRDFQPVLDGWFVSSGLAPGERVVATGAAALLGIESPASADTDPN